MMLRSAMVGLLVALLWNGAGRAEGAADHQAIERVITSQIEAFRRDAGEEAFGYASPNIRSMFGDAGRFMGMVRQGYAPVYRPRSFEFGALETVEGRVVQRVQIVGPDGAAAEALYTMEQEPDGTWRIDGCQLLRSAELRA